MSGGVQGALEEYEENARSRVRAYSGSVVKEQPQTHIMLGDLRISTDIGSELALSHAEIFTDLIYVRGADMADRIRLKGHAAFIAQHSRKTINEMISKSGASSFHID